MHESVAVCTKCSETKELGMFRVRKNRSGGHYPSCRACEREACRQSYAANAAERKERVREYAKANADKISDQHKTYYLNNKKTILAYTKAWAEQNRAKSNSAKKAWADENPDKRRSAAQDWVHKNYAKHCANTARRGRAKVIRAMLWASSVELSKAYASARKLTLDTRVLHEVDHVFPLQGLTVSGLHVPANLRVVTRSANRAKGAKLPGYLVEQLWVDDARSVYFEGDSKCTTQ